MSLPLHGANYEALYAGFGLEVPHDLPILDFSTNTNVVEWGGDLRFDIAALAADYPDPESLVLRKVIAAREGCSVDNVLITNGSNEAIYLIASYFGGQRAFIHDPVYGEYRRACESYGVGEARCAEEADLRFICNPCNPTGAYLRNQNLEGMLGESEKQLFVIDEAYRDFLRVGDRPFDFLKFPNAIVLRSLTKIFHLCGARIGYVLASGEWVDKLKKRQPVWSVNAFAQELCLRFLSDPDFVGRTRAFYEAETPRFMDRLEKIGLRLIPTRTNFFLVAADDDETTIAELLKRGIVVRHTRNFKGLDGRYLRVAARLPAENDRFADTAAALKALHGERVF